MEEITDILTGLSREDLIAKLQELLDLVDSQAYSRGYDAGHDAGWDDATEFHVC